MKGFYFVTETALSRHGIFHDARQAVAAGAACVQYRRKEACTLELYDDAVKLRSICRGVPLVINDRADICLAVGADGVHLGQEDLPLCAARRLLGKKRIIGVTVHSIAEALAAESGGADYLGVSPIFGTSTKCDAGTPAGVELLRLVRVRTRLPLVAIGGITLANASSCVSAGADAVCAISAVVSQNDVKKEIMKFRRLFR
jgi:thiamine-phosphate pyrophosphorylase